MVDLALVRRERPRKVRLREAGVERGRVELDDRPGPRQVEEHGVHGQAVARVRVAPPDEGRAVARGGRRDRREVVVVEGRAGAHEVVPAAPGRRAEVAVERVEAAVDPRLRGHRARGEAVLDEVDLHRAEGLGGLAHGAGRAGGGAADVPVPDVRHAAEAADALEEGAVGRRVERQERDLVDASGAVPGGGARQRRLQRRARPAPDPAAEAEQRRGDQGRPGSPAEAHHHPNLGANVAFPIQVGCRREEGSAPARFVRALLVRGRARPRAGRRPTRAVREQPRRRPPPWGTA